MSSPIGLIVSGIGISYRQLGLLSAIPDDCRRALATQIEVMTCDLVSIVVHCRALVAWRCSTYPQLYALLLLLCGPFSIYFTSFLTEVLFVLLTNCINAGFATFRLSGRRRLRRIAVGHPHRQGVHGLCYRRAMSPVLEARMPWRALLMSFGAGLTLSLRCCAAPLKPVRHGISAHIGALAFSRTAAWGRANGTRSIFSWHLRPAGFGFGRRQISGWRLRRGRSW